MHTLSSSPSKIVTPKLYRPREVSARKWTAYHELTGPDTAYSQRVAAQVLKIPRSTLQYWHQSDISADELDRFFASHTGVAFLHRTVSAALFVIQYRNCGSRGLQEFLQLSGLERWTANSTGAVHCFAHRFEKAIAVFGQEQRQVLFHVQQDFSRATAGALKAQERELEKELEKAEKTLKRTVEKRGKDSDVAREAEQARNLKAYGLDLRKNRREAVKAAIKGIGQDYHPIDPCTTAFH